MGSIDVKCFPLTAKIKAISDIRVLPKSMGIDWVMLGTFRILKHLNFAFDPENGLVNELRHIRTSCN